MKNNVLLVGGAGYIGSVLTEHLLSGGFNVKCFDALIYSQKQNIKKFIKFPKNINQKQIIAFFDKNTNTATPLNRCVVK